MGALWVARGPTLLQGEKLRFCSYGVDVQTDLSLHLRTCHRISFLKSFYLRPNKKNKCVSVTCLKTVGREGTHFLFFFDYFFSGKKI